RLRVLLRAYARAERLLPAAQPRPGHPGSVPGGRGHASRGRRAGRDQLGQGHRVARRPGLPAVTARVSTTPADVDACRQVIAAHSKSFALASTLFSAPTRDCAAIVYAWCRRADDAIDAAPPEKQQAAVDALRAELHRVYGGGPLPEPVLGAFRDVVRAC